jgi:predicted dehydrogenase
MVSIGVVGFGYWGPNMVRNFSHTAGSTVVAVCDRDLQRLALAKQQYPHIETFSDYEAMLKLQDLDAVVIATPVSSHCSLALQALQAGKHVLVEKPIATSTLEAKQMIDAAHAAQRVLMVDHTFIYTAAVRRIKSLVQDGTLGQLQYYDSTRVNLGIFQRDVNVIWDLAIHDLSIMDYILPFRPEAVSATGIRHFENTPENVAYLTLFFAEPFLAHIHVNWLSPVKIRQTLLGGTKKMILYNDLEPTEKLKIYDYGITVNHDNLYQTLVDYRTGDIWAPKLDTLEALQRETRHFIDCIQNGTVPETSAESGLQAVKIMEAASLSLRERGKIIQLT